MTEPRWEIVYSTSMSVQREDGRLVGYRDGERMSEEKLEELLDCFGFAGDMIRNGEI